MTWSTQYLGVSLILALCSCYQLSNGTPHDSLHLRITKRQGGSLCCSGWNFGTCEVMLPTFFRNGLPFHERNASLYRAGPSCSTNLQLTPADEGTWTCGVLIGSEWTYSDELEVNGMFLFLSLHDIICLIVYCLVTAKERTRICSYIHYLFDNFLIVYCTVQTFALWFHGAGLI